MTQYRLITYYKNSKRVDVGMIGEDKEKLLFIAQFMIEDKTINYCEVVEVKEKVER